jgi:hypothetical protein
MRGTEKQTKATRYHGVYETAEDRYLVALLVDGELIPIETFASADEAARFYDAMIEYLFYPLQIVPRNSPGRSSHGERARAEYVLHRLSGTLKPKPKRSGGVRKDKRRHDKPWVAFIRVGARSPGVIGSYRTRAEAVNAYHGLLDRYGLTNYPRIS